MATKPDFIKNSISHRSLSELNKIATNVASAASSIEELLIEAGTVSKFLQERQGVTIWKFRDCCDELVKINRELHECAEKFERYLAGEETDD